MLPQAPSPPHSWLTKLFSVPPSPRPGSPPRHVLKKVNEKFEQLQQVLEEAESTSGLEPPVAPEGQTAANACINGRRVEVLSRTITVLNKMLRERLASSSSPSGSSSSSPPSPSPPLAMSEGVAACNRGPLVEEETPESLSASAAAAAAAAAAVAAAAAGLPTSACRWR